jgi:hypothetical protein
MYDDNQNSGLSGLKCGVEMLELNPGIMGGKPPIDRVCRLIALCFPGCNFRLESCSVWNPSVKTLLGQHTQLNFGHVEPALPG